MPLAFCRAMLLALFACWGLPAAALESAPATSPRATASLVSDVDTVAPGQPFRVGLRLRLAPGWHTYWQNPGDAGVPPELDLTLPPGATAGPIAWPAPQRVAEGSVDDLRLQWRGAAAGHRYPCVRRRDRRSRRTRTGWCAARSASRRRRTSGSICPPGTPAPSAQAPLFAASDRQVPRPSPWHAVVGQDGTLLVQGPELTPADRGRRLVHSRCARHHPRQRRAAADRLAWRLHAGAAAGQGVPRGRASCQASCRSATAAGWRPTLRCTPLPAPCRRDRRRCGCSACSALAFLGGLILNLMPCVFPVLAMKVVGLAGAARGKARWQAVAYTAGVLVAFAGARRGPAGGARRGHGGRAGGSSSSRRCSSPPWPGCCSPSG